MDVTASAPPRRRARWRFRRWLRKAAFAFYNIGNASAVVVIFFIIVMALALLLLYVRQRTQWT